MSYMNDKPDAKAILENLGVRKSPIYPDYRPAIRIKDDYMTTSKIDFEGIISGNESKEVEICFLSPKYYGNTLWTGRKLEVYEGERLVAYAVITKIFNPVPNRDKEKYVMVDGRNMSNWNTFYEEIQNKLTKGLGWKMGHNLNALDDVLRGGFGCHEYGEVLHIVFIYTSKVKEHMEQETFDTILGIMKGNENIRLECYEEHAF